MSETQKVKFNIEEVEKYYERLINIGDYQNIRVGIKLKGKCRIELGKEEDEEKLKELSWELVKTAGNIIEIEAKKIKEKFA